MPASTKQQLYYTTDAYPQEVLMNSKIRARENKLLYFFCLQMAGEMSWPIVASKRLLLNKNPGVGENVQTYLIFPYFFPVR